MSDTALHLPVRDRQTLTPTPPPCTRLLRSMRRTDVLSVKPADLAVLHLRIRTDWSNVRSGSSMYNIYIYAQSGAEKCCDFFFLNAPSFLLHLPFFVCAVSVPAPLTRHEHSGAPRVQQ